VGNPTAVAALHVGAAELAADQVGVHNHAQGKPRPEGAATANGEAAWRIGVPPYCRRVAEDANLGLPAVRAAGVAAVEVTELLRPLNRRTVKS